jgi:hypothetical protein
MPRIARTMGLAFGLAGGIAASQGPEFAQQYRQRLGGAVDELRRVVERFDADAQGVGQTREGAIAQLQGNPDRLASAQADAARGNAARLQHLDRQRRDLADAGPVGRAYLLASEGDLDVMRAAFRDYEPAVPTTTGGLVVAAIGFVLGYAFSRLVGMPLRRLLFRRRRERLRTA